MNALAKLLSQFGNFGLQVAVIQIDGLTESYPLCANFPFMEVRDGSMGKPMPGWGAYPVLS